MDGRLPIVFWTTGGVKSGLGHVRRCLSLAEAVREIGADASFVLESDRMVLNYVEERGFRAVPADRVSALGTVRNENGASVVIDSYAVPSEELAAVRERSRAIVIDDLADREFPVDLVVNSSPSMKVSDYTALPSTRFLLGPEYALLRCEFDSGIPEGRVRRRVRRILVTVGGSDPHRITGTLVTACAKAVTGVRFDVIAGPLFDETHGTDDASGSPVNWHRDPADIRSLMLDSDLAVCGGGQTIFELAATATPAIAVRTASNQTGNLEAFSRAGALEWAADAEDADLAAHVGEAVKRVFDDFVRRETMSRRGSSLVDGRGAKRVAAVLLEER